MFLVFSRRALVIRESDLIFVLADEQFAKVTHARGLMPLSSDGGWTNHKRSHELDVQYPAGFVIPLFVYFYI